MDGAAVVLMPRLAHREMVCASDDTVERIGNFRVRSEKVPAWRLSTAVVPF